MITGLSRETNAVFHDEDEYDHDRAADEERSDGTKIQYRYAQYSHIYTGDMDNPGWPMCPEGWNRDDGHGYSIWRNNDGEDGVCPVCRARWLRGLPPVPRADGPTIENAADMFGFLDNLVE